MGLHTFLDPANPSDSVKKYAKGMRKTRDRLEKRKTKFQRPGGGGQGGQNGVRSQCRMGGAQHPRTTPCTHRG